MRVFPRMVATCSAAGVAMALASGARAQTAPAVPSDRPVSSPIPGQASDAGPQAAAGSGDIIVTAERRSQRLEEVPAAITAISADQLAKSGVVKFMDIAQLAAGVQIQKNGYTTQPSVRGVTSLTTGVGFENNTALYIDGFYQPDSVAINADLANITQVEILKGPQGTLYGRNATAGAILINTREPTDTFGGELRGSYSRYNDRQLQGYLNVPLAKDVAFNVAGSYRRSDGYIRDLGTDGRGTNGYDAVPARNDTVRAKLRLRPADWATITFGYNYTEVLDAVGLAYTIYNYALPSLPQPPLRATQPDTVTNNGRPDNTAEMNEGTVRAEIETGLGKLDLRTSYGNRTTHIAYDFDGSKLDLFRGIIPSTQKTFQQAADFSATPLANLNLLVGANYFNDAIDVTAQQAVINGAVTTTDYTNLRAEAFAAYVDGTYTLGAFSLTGGARYTSEHKTVSYREVAANPVLPGSGAATFSRVTPRVVAKYEVGPRTNVYASFSTGFRSGVFQNQALVNPAFEVPIQPETIRAYEVGLKLARTGFRFDTAMFYYDYSNLHVGVTVTNPITGVGSINILSNAKAAELYGVEAQASGTPLSGWNVSAGLSLIHARYTDFHNATGTGLNVATQRDVTNQAQDWTGQQMARAPTASATFQTDYSFGLAGGRAQLALNASYSSSFVVNNPSLYGPLAGAALAGQQRYRQGAYGLLNLQASWTNPSDRYTLGIFANNVTDTRYQLVTSGGAYGDYRQFNQPVTVGGRASIRF